MSEIEGGHKSLSGKCVFKLKCNVNGDITWFKVCRIVCKYIQQLMIHFNQIYIAIVEPIIFKELFLFTVYYDLDIH